MTKTSDHFKLVHEYLESGLVPVRGFTMGEVEDFRSMLESLSPKERRVATRKFRKKWRKLMKSLPGDSADELTDDSPRVCAARRRRAVHRSMLLKIMEKGDG